MINKGLVLSAILLTTGALTPFSPASAGSYPRPADDNPRYVIAFGAVCDGSTDDRAALQSALNAIRNGGQLVFPAESTCMIKGSLTLNNGRNWTILGEDATIKMDSSVPGTGKTLPNWILSTKKNKNFSIYDLTFDGNSQNRQMPAVESGQQNSAHNLKIWQGTDFKIIRTRFINSAMDGVLVGANMSNPTNRATKSARGVFSEVNASNNWRNGLVILNGEDIIIEDSVFANTRGDWPQAGIDIEANSGSYTPSSKNITVQRNMLYNNVGYGIQLLNKFSPTLNMIFAKNVIIRNNHISNNMQGGVEGDGVDVSIVRNRFVDFQQRLIGKTLTTKGVVVLGRGATRVNIDNNTFQTVYDYGKALLYVAGNSRTGHTFVGNCIEDVGVAALWDPKRRVGTVNNGPPPAAGCPDPTS